MAMDLSQQIDGILPYLKWFETPGFSYGHFEATPHGHFASFITSEAACGFVFDLYRYGWVQPFDWMAWQDEASKYVNDAALVESADVEIIRKLLTLHARNERFCEGHLGVMYEMGHLTSLLRRLKAIRAKVSGRTP
jgi:hypothetical protein